MKKILKIFIDGFKLFIFRKRNPYLLDFPVNNPKYDYIGFDAQVDSLYQNIRSGAKMIGIVADYGSGKSSIVSLLQKKLFFLKYKIIKINLWNSNKTIPSTPPHPPQNVEIEKFIYDIHKKFLFQLSSEINPSGLKHLTRKLNSNYSNASISAKNKRTYFFIILSLICFIISFMNKNELLGYFNFLPSLNLQWTVPYLKEFANFSGIIGILLFVISLITGDVVFSSLKADTNKERTITENDTIEAYLDIINDKHYFSIKYWFKCLFNYKTIIVIEDLDRIEDDTYTKMFLQQIYTFYGHSNNKNVVFIIALGSKNYFEKIEEHYKVFDYTVDLQKLKSTDFMNIFKRLLLTKANILKLKYNININNEEIGKWMWLAQGKDLNIRQIKHRYNEALLLYSSLINRFSKEKSINLKSCIAVTYLKNEYPLLYNELTSENKYADSNHYSTIKILVNSFIKNKDISYLALWTFASADFGKGTDKQLLESFQKDFFQLLESEYINDTFEIYFYNYPKTNKIFTVEEDKFYQSYMYDKKLKNINAILDVINSNNKEFIINTINRVRELNIPYPAIIFQNEILFEKVYTTSSQEEKQYIFKSMLSITPQTSTLTFHILRKIKSYSVVNDDFISEYIKSIKSDFRKNNEDLILSNSRAELLRIFSDSQDLFIDFYRVAFPSPNQHELRFINSFETAISFVNFSLINPHTIDDISFFINKKFKNNDFKLLYDFMKNLSSDFIKQLFTNLRISSRLNDTQKLVISSEYFKKLDLNIPTNLMNFIKKLKYSNELLEESLISNVEEGKIKKDEYCKFIDKYLIDITQKTLEYITNDNFKCDFAFNENIQNKMFNGKYYNSYVISKLLYNNSLFLEYSRLNELKDTYIKLYTDKELYQKYSEYIIKNETLLTFYKNKKVYLNGQENQLIPFSYLTQDYEMLNANINSINDANILNEYILNIPSINFSEENGKILLKTYADKLANISEDAYRHFRNLLPKELKYTYIRYRATRKVA